MYRHSRVFLGAFIKNKAYLLSEIDLVIDYIVSFGIIYVPTISFFNQIIPQF